MYCPHCGKAVKDQAVTCSSCGAPIRGTLNAVKTKNKTTAILLAVFLAFWTWCYTYKKDAWKFWLNFGLSLVSIGYWIPVAWIWAIIDASRRPAEFYNDFYQSLFGRDSNPSATEKTPQILSNEPIAAVDSSRIGQTYKTPLKQPPPPPWPLSTITTILFATTLLPPIGMVAGLIALMKAKTRHLGVWLLSLSIIFLVTWFVFTPIGGILFCLVFTSIVVFSRPPQCGNCGQQLPKYRTQFSFRYAMSGGGICPYCESKVDRKGRVLS